MERRNGSNLCFSLYFRMIAFQLFKMVRTEGIKRTTETIVLIQLRKEGGWDWGRVAGEVAGSGWTQLQSVRHLG